MKEQVEMELHWKDVEKGLRRMGWLQVGSRGDHFYFKNPEMPGKVTVPHYKSIGSGALSRILLPTGVKPDDFARKYVRVER